MGKKQAMISMIFGLILITLLLGSVYSCRYDTSTVQFDPTGRLLQTEYARTAIEKKGGPICAIRCTDGVILVGANQQHCNSLSVRPAQKFFFVDRHICIAASGVLSDSNMIIDLAEKECNEYKTVFGSPIPVEKLCSKLSDIFHLLTRDRKYRPFAVSLVIAGYDDILGSQLYSTDPDGSFNAWNALAVGKDSNLVVDSLLNSNLLFEEDSVVLRDVSSCWPEFRSKILVKHFDGMEEEEKSLQDMKSAEETLKSESLQWEMEGFAGIKTSSGEFQWTPITNKDVNLLDSNP